MIIVLITLSLLAYYAIEQKLHLKRLNNIPIRILVTGTRGKSSIVRLLHAALSMDRKTVAKTTGSLAALIDQNSSENVLKRNGPANILEHKKVVKWASRVRPDVLIIESMALRPELQKMESFVLVQPHITVLTNTRSDHLDVMGEDNIEITKTYLRTLFPSSQKIVTKDFFEQLISPFSKEKDFGFALLEKSAISEIKKSLPYIEHDENIQLAYSVCKSIGLSNEKIISGMKRTKPDPGAMIILRTKLSGQKVTFVNAFAANDPESILSIWHLIQEKLDFAKSNIFLIVNTRKDRPHRTIQLAQLLEKDIQADQYFVTGTNIDLFMGYFKDTPRNDQFRIIRGQKAKKVIQKLESLMEQETIIIGIGNYYGIAGKLVEILNIEGKFTNARLATNQIVS